MGIGRRDVRRAGLRPAVDQRRDRQLVQRSQLESGDRTRCRWQRADQQRRHGNADGHRSDAAAWQPGDRHHSPRQWARHRAEHRHRHPGVRGTRSRDAAVCRWQLRAGRAFDQRRGWTSRADRSGVDGFRHGCDERVRSDVICRRVHAQQRRPCGGPDLRGGPGLDRGRVGQHRRQCRHGQRPLDRGQRHHGRPGSDRQQVHRFAKRAQRRQPRPVWRYRHLHRHHGGRGPRGRRRRARRLSGQPSAGPRQHHGHAVGHRGARLHRHRRDPGRHRRWFAHSRRAGHGRQQ